MSSEEKLYLLRYGELSLKGRNRGSFESQLARNVKEVCADLPDVRLERTYGRLYLRTRGGHEEVVNRLQRIFGLHSFSLIRQLPLDIEELKRQALHFITSMEPVPATFKVETRRPNKRFSLASMEVSRQVGGYIREHGRIEVDVHHPDCVLHVEVRDEGINLYSGFIPGAGGLPVGSSGRVGLLLSGGIDSPVAGWQMMKRGLRLEPIHFYSYPFTSEQSLKKVEDLTQVLTRFGGAIPLHVVPFTEIQTAIRKDCPENLTITVMRRMMMRIAQKIAEQRNLPAIATGESLGQVASQTLESIQVINRVIALPVLRPLISFDKEEIIQISRNIGTYDISIRPYEDCCTVFTPKNPVTRPSLRKVEWAEQHLDVGALVDLAVSKREVKMFSRQQRKEFQYF